MEQAFSYPEFDEEESVGGSSLKQLLQPAFLLRELVVDLSDVNSL